MRLAKHIVLPFALFLALSSAASAASLTRNEAALLSVMNSVRAAHGLRPLRLDPQLLRAARAHSLDELRRGYFAHGAFATRLGRFGARERLLGENLAWGAGAFGSAASIVGLWLASPEHRANLLSPGFTRVGVATPYGTFEEAAGVTMATADFAG